MFFRPFRLSLPLSLFIFHNLPLGLRGWWTITFRHEGQKLRLFGSGVTVWKPFGARSENSMKHKGPSLERFFFFLIIIARSTVRRSGTEITLE